MRKKLLDLWSLEGLRIGRYSLVGIGNTVNDFLAFWILCVAFQITPLLANAIAFAVAVSISYVLNSCWTFKVRKFGLKSFLLFVAVNIFNLALSTLTIYLSSPWASPLLAKIIAAGLVLIWGYSLSRGLVFTLPGEAKKPLKQEIANG